MNPHYDPRFATKLHEPTYAIKMMPGGNDAWSLTGFAENHPRFNDGDPIRISQVISYDSMDRSVTTISGSVYSLVDPSIKTLAQIVSDIEEFHKTKYGDV